MAIKVRETNQYHGHLSSNFTNSAIIKNIYQNTQMSNMASKVIKILKIIKKNKNFSKGH